MAEILIAVGCFAFVIIVTVTSIIKRKKGKCCSGDCANCSSCNIKK